MKTKVMILMVVIMLLVGTTVADEEDLRFVGRQGRQRIGPVRQILRPLLIGRPIFQGGRVPFQQGGGVPLQGGGGGAAGLGGGSVQNNQAIGTGTGIANPGPGGFGIGLGIGAAVATPIGNFALGEGNSVSVGK